MPQQDADIFSKIFREIGDLIFLITQIRLLFCI